MLQRSAWLDSAHYGQLPVLSQFYILSTAQSNDNDHERSSDATFKGHTVAHLVQAMPYKLEGHGFDSRRRLAFYCNIIKTVTLSLTLFKLPLHIVLEGTAEKGNTTYKSTETVGSRLAEAGSLCTNKYRICPMRNEVRNSNFLTQVTTSGWLAANSQPGPSLATKAGRIKRRVISQNPGDGDEVGL